MPSFYGFCKDGFDFIKKSNQYEHDICKKLFFLDAYRFGLDFALKEYSDGLFNEKWIEEFPKYKATRDEKRKNAG